MNEEVKKLVESVKVTNLYSIDFIYKSDFDRIVEALCKENKRLMDLISVNNLHDNLSESLM